MNRFITSVFLTLLVLGFSLESVKAQVPAPDQIGASQVSIRLADSATSVFKLSDTPAQLVAAFGKPVSTSNAFSGTDNTTVNRYNFEDLELYFEGDKLFALKVKGPAVTINLDNKIAVKTGDHISALGMLFPNSYTSRENGQLLIDLKLADGKATDSSITFLFDSDGMITEIVM